MVTATCRAQEDRPVSKPHKPYKQTMSDFVTDHLWECPKCDGPMLPKAMKVCYHDPAKNDTEAKKLLEAMK